MIISDSVLIETVKAFFPIVAPVLVVLATWNQQRGKLKQVHKAVNGNLERMESKLNAALIENQELRQENNRIKHILSKSGIADRQ